jgi:hypothetical protein
MHFSCVLLLLPGVGGHTLHDKQHKAGLDGQLQLQVALQPHHWACNWGHTPDRRA